MWTVQGAVNLDYVICGMCASASIQSSSVACEYKAFHISQSRRGVRPTTDCVWLMWRISTFYILEFIFPSFKPRLVFNFGRRSSKTFKEYRTHDPRFHKIMRNCNVISCQICNIRQSTRIPLISEEFIINFGIYWSLPPPPPSPSRVVQKVSTLRYIFLIL